MIAAQTCLYAEADILKQIVMITNS